MTAVTDTKRLAKSEWNMWASDEDFEFDVRSKDGSKKMPEPLPETGVKTALEVVSVLREFSTLDSVARFHITKAIVECELGCPVQVINQSIVFKKNDDRLLIDRRLAVSAVNDTFARLMWDKMISGEATPPEVLSDFCFEYDFSAFCDLFSLWVTEEEGWRASLSARMGRDPEPELLGLVEFAATLRWVT